MTGVDEDFLRVLKANVGGGTTAGGLRIRPEVDDVLLVRWVEKERGRDVSGGSPSVK